MHTHTHDENSDLIGYAFVPLSTKTFSRLSKPAMVLLDNLAECALVSGIVFKDGFVVNSLRELSVGLCRGNCVLYKRSLYVLVCMSGHTFCADADIPISEINLGWFLSLSIDCHSAFPWCCSFASLDVVTHTQQHDIN